MAKMTRDEAIKNVTVYVYMECLNMPNDVIRALDVLKDSAMAWDKVIEDIKKLKKDTACGLEAADKEIFNKGLETALDSIYLYMPEELNKHLQEE